MKQEFWHNCWETSKTGWQQQRVNSRLQRYWPDIEARPGSTVFVPLCGDSIDMLWLRDQGFQVLGSELSQTAVEQFFSAHDIKVNVSVYGAGSGMDSASGTLYEGDGVSILCGDFFALNESQLEGVEAVYDRAATVAMPPDMRKQYAEHLGRLVAPDTSILLISMNYDQKKMNGPPFSVDDDDIKRLYDESFFIRHLGGVSGPEILGNLADRGLDTLEENVYHLKRAATGSHGSPGPLLTAIEDR